MPGNGPAPLTGGDGFVPQIPGGDVVRPSLLASGGFDGFGHCIIRASNRPGNPINDANNAIRHGRLTRCGKHPGPRRSAPAPCRPEREASDRTQTLLSQSSPHTRMGVSESGWHLIGILTQAVLMHGCARANAGWRRTPLCIQIDTRVKPAREAGTAQLKLTHNVACRMRPIEFPRKRSAARPLTHCR